MRAGRAIASSASIALLLIVLGGESPPAGDRAAGTTARVGAPGSEATALEPRAEPPPGDAGLAPEAAVLATAPADARDAESPSGSPACPDDMAYVETSFCPDVERRCVDMEHERVNHLEICHAFAHEQRCRTAERPIAFCIDRYEYPNRAGAHPTWMVSWYDAQATCESKGKRLCWASEWTAACEGPAHTPFPYGWERNHERCNMDNFFIEPKKFGPRGQFLFYAKDRDIQAKELARLDQSVPSGSMESCRSGFGVYDLPGNVDEWVVSDQPPQEVSKWAGLKGGAWGHVRSQCRPMTYSHDPAFTYYFVGFRCCKDPDAATGVPPWRPSPAAIPAPPVEAHDFAAEAPPAPASPVADLRAEPRKKWSRDGRVE